MIAILEARKAGLLGRGYWLSNLTAGVIVGVVALPLAMAFAIASGVDPQQGIYTSIIAGIVVSLFGGSRIQIAGPTGAFIVILAGITARFGVDGLLLATFMAGIMLILMGVAKFGVVIRFIPAPVILGFTAGIGVIIWVGQWRDFFGLPAVPGGHFYQKVIALAAVLPQMDSATTALAVASLVLVVFGPRLPGCRRLPGPLIAMVLATFAQHLSVFSHVATIGSTFGGIPEGLPRFQLPAFSFDKLTLLLPSAFTIAMLGAIESLLSAVVSDGMAGTRHDSNQELIGQGIANVLSPLFGGIAATGAIARTATNFKNGGSSPLAGITHSLTLVVILLFLAPLAARVPICTLAAILFVVAWNMSEARHFVRMVFRAPRADVAILLITFLLTIFTDLVIAVNIGVILAMFQFLRRMSTSVEVLQVGEVQWQRELDGFSPEDLPPGVLVYSIDGPFFFGAVDSLEKALLHTRGDPRFLIFRLGRVPFMDITGIHALEEAVLNLERRGVQVIICEANLRVLRKLLRAGVVRRQKPRRYARDLQAAINQCRRMQRGASAVT